jgi:GT2 family glycosyltransferase
MISYCIVINTFKRSVTLVEKSLRSALNQKYLPQKLILIDQNNTALELASDLKAHPLLMIQKSLSSSVSGARNEVILPENCEWICFCDDDGYWDSDYSENLQSLLTDNKFDVIAGSVIRSDTRGFYSLRHRFGGDMAQFRNLKLLMGSNFCVRRRLFEQVNRFDDRFGAGAYWGSSEETDFAWKCFFAGAKMTYQPQLRVIHVPPFNESVRKGFGKSYRYAVGKGALVGKWLWEEKKITATHELLEMMLVPFLQIIRSILILNGSLLANSFAVWSGRLIGFLWFLLLFFGGKNRSR